MTVQSQDIGTSATCEEPKTFDTSPTVRANLIKCIKKSLLVVKEKQADTPTVRPHVRRSRSCVTHFCHAAQVIDMLAREAHFQDFLFELKTKYELSDSLVSERFQFAYDQLRKSQAACDRHFRGLYHTQFPDHIYSLFLLLHTVKPALFHRLLHLTADDSIFCFCMRSQNVSLCISPSVEAHQKLHGIARDSAVYQSTDSLASTSSNLSISDSLFSPQMFAGRQQMDFPEFFVALHHTGTGNPCKIGLWLEENANGERSFASHIVQCNSISDSKDKWSTRWETGQFSTVCEFIRYEIESQLNSLVNEFTTSSDSSWYDAKDGLPVADRFGLLYVLRDILSQYIDPTIADRKEMASDYVEAYCKLTNNTSAALFTADTTAFSPTQLDWLNSILHDLTYESSLAAPPLPRRRWFFQRWNVFSLFGCLPRHSQDRNKGSELSGNVLPNALKKVSELIRYKVTVHTGHDNGGDNSTRKIAEKEDTVDPYWTPAAAAIADAELESNRELVLYIGRHLIQTESNNRKLFQFGCELVSMVYESRNQRFLSALARDYVKAFV
eukprot:GILK01013613.1.p1 GENE.GILK01013613.1~~GILK01013613.1.p1  ORF type:complete len:554 (+),score=69.07 GILK01013613.1:86-1747(+)